MNKNSISTYVKSALVFGVIASFPEIANAGWLEDAAGDFARETLADSKTLGVVIAAIGFIWGLLAYVLSWGSLKLPLIAILVGTLVGLADTFIGTA